MSRTPNIGLPLRLAGHVPTQRSIAEGFTIIDAEIAAAKLRLDNIESGLGGDSNGGGEEATTWQLTFTGMIDPVAQNFDINDTITLGDKTYTFVYGGELPGDEGGSLFTGPDQINTHMEFGADSESGNYNGILSTVSGLVYIAANLIGAGVSAYILSEGTEAPVGIGLDMDSYAAWVSAVPADPDQSEGPWPALVFTFSSPVSCSINTIQPFQLTPV